MFNPNNLDNVCVQATHLDARRENNLEEGSKKPFKSKGKETVSKARERKLHLSRRKEINMQTSFQRGSR